MKSSSILGNKHFYGFYFKQRDARRKLMMTADTKDAKTFFSVKKRELERSTTLELSFVESLFMMYKLRKKIAKPKAECTSFDNIRMYSHNFGDFMYHDE